MMKPTQFALTATIASLLAIATPLSFAQDAAATSPMPATQGTTLPGELAPAPTAPREPGTPDPARVHPDLKGVFADFGGMPGMTALMEDFMEELLKDPRTRPFFENTDHVRIKRQLAEQFCAILDGGCTYSGRDMKAAHAAFSIDKADFNALVEDLQVAMNRKKIPFASQNKLLAVLAPMHRQVINKK